jgi:hypothetical protein
VSLPVAAFGGASNPLSRICILHAHMRTKASPLVYVLRYISGENLEKSLLRVPSRELLEQSITSQHGLSLEKAFFKVHDERHNQDCSWP